MNATADTRVKRLADALGAVSLPLARLVEYVGDLERHTAENGHVEVECIAALVRAQARAVKRDLILSLTEIEEAATGVVNAGPARHFASK